MQMQRIVGGLVAAVATVALWGCDAVKNFVQSSLPMSNATATPTGESPVGLATSTPRPTVPITFVIDPTPEPTPAMGTVIITPDASASWNSPTPTPSPTPTATPSPSPTPMPIYPLWDRYRNGSFPRREFPESVQVLQAWQQHGINFQGEGVLGCCFNTFKFELDGHAREKAVGMGFDREIGKPVYEFAFLSQASYSQLQTPGILPMSQLSYKGPYNAGLAATFVERDGNLEFHKAGPRKQVTVDGNEYGIYSIAGHRGLDRHLNGAKAEIWDFSKLKSEFRLIPPAGLLNGVDVTVDLALAATFTGNDPDIESVRIAYDASQGILLIGGGASTSDWIPDAWWGAVRETSSGAKKLHVGYKVPMWYLAEYWRRILAWYVVDGTMYAFTGRGSKSTCDFITKETIYRDKAGLDCHPVVMRFPLDFIMDPEPKPEWVNK